MGKASTRRRQGRRELGDRASRRVEATHPPRDGCKSELVAERRLKAIVYPATRRFRRRGRDRGAERRGQGRHHPSYAAIRRGIQKLRDKYAEEGYFLAEVDYEIIPQKSNEVVLKFTIREHEQVTVRRITFIGNYSVPDAELREVMLTGQTSFFDFGSGGSFRQDAFERDVLVINALYYDRGYLSVQVATPRVMLTPDRTGIEITISIVEGPRYKIRSLRVYERSDDGKEVEPIGGRRALREMVRARPGDWFNRAELAKDLAAIQTMYRDHGYANVAPYPATELYADKRGWTAWSPSGRNLVYSAHRGARTTKPRHGYPSRDDVERAASSARASWSAPSGASPPSATSNASTSPPSRVTTRTTSTSTSRSARSRPAPSRSAPASRASRTSSPPRRCSRPTSSAMARASACRRNIGRRSSSSPLLRAVLPPASSQVVVGVRPLRIYDQFLQSEGRVADFGYPITSPSARSGPHTGSDEISTSPPRLLGTPARLHLPRLPLYNI